MRLPALEPVILTAFIPLMGYAYRSIPYIELSTGTKKHNNGYQMHTECQYTNKRHFWCQLLLKVVVYLKDLLYHANKASDEKTISTPF